MGVFCFVSDYDYGYSTQPYEQANVKFEEDEQKYQPDKEHSNGDRTYEDYEEGEAY